MKLQWSHGSTGPGTNELQLELSLFWWKDDLENWFLWHHLKCHVLCLGKDIIFHHDMFWTWKSWRISHDMILLFPSEKTLFPIGPWQTFTGFVIFSKFGRVSIIENAWNTSGAAQGGGGSFENRKPIGEVGWSESRMAERIHWWTGGWSCVIWSGCNVCSGHLTTTAGCSCSCSCSVV